MQAAAAGSFENQAEPRSAKLLVSPTGQNAKETGEPMQGIFMRLSTLHTLCTEANQAEDNLLRPSSWNVLDGAAFKGVLAP